MKMLARALSLLLLVIGVFAGGPLNATNILNTKHNLSITGPGTIKALTENRICVFCHTPHNASPRTPLWNKNLQAVNYTLYSSTTLIAIQSQPTGPSRLCLSCHDGTIALGEVIKPSGGISMTVAGGIPSGRPSYLGTTLSGDHPVSFSYYNSLPNPELSPVLPSGLLFYGNGTMHCTTCHDPHDNTNGNFLSVNGVNSGLCTRCHMMNGWAATPHNTSLDTWNGVAPNPWPLTGAGTAFNWTTVQQNGCENCHTSHNATGTARLLNCYTALGPCNPPTDDGVCYPCHNGSMVPGIKNIFAELNNTSRHALTGSTHDPRETGLINNHVVCVDCHDPHKTNNNKPTTPPTASGRLDGVSGITINYSFIKPAVNEYEICFKCHASPTPQSIFPPIPRVINEANLLMKFQQNNPSFHPVAAIGLSADVPSLIMPFTTSSMIYCTDCHSDESVANGGSGSRGPHGSKYAPILRDQYKTTNDGSLYNSSNFQLCYDCHYESSILSDVTFQKNSLFRGGHSGHLQAITDANNTIYYIYANCSVCHDPHGVRNNGISGSHKRLINFDTRVVSVLPGTGFNYPVFAGSGNRAGNCALVCHLPNGATVTHDGSATFSYGGAPAIGPGSVQTIW
ncbi:MAG TPA: cytochrome c3 family protein [Nitrospirota bacterium]